MSDGTLTHKDLAELLGVSETTIKSYRKKFPGALPVASKGKPIRFKAEAADICLKIRDLFSLGSSVEEVQEQLFTIFAWRKPKIPFAGGKKLPQSNMEQNNLNLSQSFANALESMAKSISAINQTHTDILSALKKMELKISDFEQKFQNFLLNSPLAEQKAVVGNLPLLKQSTPAKPAKKQFVSPPSSDVAAQNLLVNEALASVSTGAEYQSGQSDKSHKAALHTGISGHILHLPLLMRREDGTYAIAGGEKFGRLSLNDVLALLNKAYPAQNGCTLRLEQDGCGTWAVLTLLDSGTAEIINELRFTVHEITSAKGVGVLEIKNCLHNKIPRPVSFFSEFLQSAAERR
jgi:hypothetical protein